MENKLIELFVLICRFYDTQPVLKEQRLSNNHQPLFADEELLTVYIFGHLQGLTTQRQIYDYTLNHWREWFPALPAYQTFNDRLNRLDTAFELLIEQVLLSAAWQIQSTDDRLIDSVPVMLARGARASRGRVAPDLADTGFCASKKTYYYGCKLHLIGARRLEQMPLPEKIHLSQASQHDLSAVVELDPHLPAGSSLFADKAYCSTDTAKVFQQRGTQLAACYKRRRNQSEAEVPTLYNRFVSATRQPIESLFGWLIEKTDLQNASRVRSSQGLKVHCYGKLVVACLLLTFYS